MQVPTDPAELALYERCQACGVLPLPLHFYLPILLLVNPYSARATDAAYAQVV